jgi:hypothetical protein
LALLLLACAGCQGRAKAGESRHFRGGGIPPSLSPRPAGSFACDPSGCTQLHPRLPDSGEWRCAERERVVWCAGGLPAAGVAGPKVDEQFRCGRRWGDSSNERVCVDRKPDYPREHAESHSCRFEQEHGITRRCRLSGVAVTRSLPLDAVPGCWLDKDCRSRRCDRGSCGCSQDSECEVGRCRGGLCRETEP